MANNRNEGTNDYDTGKIKEEVNNIGGKTEIIELGEEGKLPLMIVIDDIGYNLDENGEVTVIKGIWVSTTNISIIEGQTYQLYVRYFDGDTSSNPVITPTGMDANISVSDTFLVTPLNKDCTSTFYATTTDPVSGQEVNSPTITVTISGLLVDMFAVNYAKPTGTFEEKMGLSLVSSSNTHIIWWEWNLIGGVRNDNPAANWNATFRFDWDTINQRPELIPEQLFVHARARGMRWNSYVASKAWGSICVGIMYKDGTSEVSPTWTVRDYTPYAYNTLNLKFLEKEIDYIELSTWRIWSLS